MAVDDYFDEPIPPARTSRVTSATIEGLRAQARRLYERANSIEVAANEQELRLTKFGPEPPEGSVVKFKRSYGTNRDVMFTYVALRKRNRWYITQGAHAVSPKPAMSWEKLLEFVGDAKLKIATQWKELRADDNS